MAISILCGCSIVNLINTDIKQMKLSLWFVPVQHNCGTCLLCDLRFDLTFGSVYHFWWWLCILWLNGELAIFRVLLIDSFYVVVLYTVYCFYLLALEFGWIPFWVRRPLWRWLCIVAECWTGHISSSVAWFLPCYCIIQYIVSICWLLSLDPISFWVRRPLLNVAVYIVAEAMTIFQATLWC